MRWIYALVDPRSGLARYVGQSADPCARLRQHESLRGTAMFEWINGLKVDGLHVTVAKLERVTADDANERESFWQAHFREHGWLLNALAHIPHVRRDLSVNPKNAGAAALVEIMKRDSLSEGCVATQIGIRQQSVSKLVHGTSKPRIGTALRIQSQFGISVSAWESSIER